MSESERASVKYWYLSRIASSTVGLVGLYYTGRVEILLAGLRYMLECHLFTSVVLGVRRFVRPPTPQLSSRFDSAYTSARSIGFCTSWICISSSSGMGLSATQISTGFDRLHFKGKITLQSTQPSGSALDQLYRIRMQVNLQTPL